MRRIEARIQGTRARERLGALIFVWGTLAAASSPAPAEAARADLVVLGIDAGGLETDGSSGEVSGIARAVVRNAGVAPSGAETRLLFFEDSNRSGGWEPDGDTRLGEAVVPPLASGERVEVEAELSGALLFPGSPVRALVDPGDRIAESDEGNNSIRTGLDCQKAPAAARFEPALEWRWSAPDASPLAGASNVLATPCVIDLDGDSVPEVVFGATSSRGGRFVEPGYLVAVRGADGSPFFAVTDPDLRINAASPPAAGDLDGDGRPEIVACRAGGNQLLAFDSDGHLAWVSPVIEAVNWGGPAIADLDGDGSPEVISGREVLRGLDGSLLWRGAGGRGSAGNGPLSFAADLDLDGELDVVAGSTLYSASGEIRWTAPGVPDGLGAVADLDGDPEGEVILVAGGALWLLDTDGSPIASAPIPGGGGGPPTVADFDGDRAPEVGVAGYSYHVVFDLPEGGPRLLWASPTRDLSSAMTGSSVFDFEGDGIAEVVYRDETTLRVYGGPDGAVLWSAPVSSCTWHEYPLVADVDADGEAEIVATANDSCGGGPQRGVYVWGDPTGGWVGTRPIWNQHAYSITGVEDDGAIPPRPKPSWLWPPEHPFNSFRQNVLSSRAPLSAPDLTASRLRIACDPAGSIVTVRVGNGGALGVEAGVPATLRALGAGGEERFFKTVATSVPLEPGDFEDVAFDLPAGLAPLELRAVADDAGEGTGAIDECDETNNAVRFASPGPICGPPLIAEIPDAVAREGERVEGPAPELLWSTPPVEWTLEVAPPGAEIDPATGAVAWVAEASLDAWRFTVRASDALGSDLESWLLSVPPSYTAWVEADLDRAPAGTEVALRGQARWIEGGGPAAGVEVSITVSSRGTSRLLAARTGDDGRFTATFTPSPGEAGSYTVAAHHPAVAPPEPQDRFALAGVLLEPGDVSVTIAPGSEQRGELRVRNLGDTPLTALVATAAGLPASLTLELDAPARLESEEEAVLSWVLRASDDSTREAEVEIALASGEGAAASARLHARVLPAAADVVIEPSSLEAVAVIAEVTPVELLVRNRGSAASGEIEVELPKAGWILLASPERPGALAPAGETAVTILLAPPEGMLPGAYPGELVVREGATSHRVPFSFTVVTEDTGDLRVIAEDELTWWAAPDADGTRRAGPALAGARVRVRDATGRSLQRSATTGEEGEVTFGDLPEGFYDLTVDAPRHGSFRATIRLAAGGRVVHAFLPRHAVDYSWRVEPTELEDRYDVRLEAVFEADVPMPVITIEPPLLDLRRLESETTQIDFTITNHGLVGAESVELVAGSHSRFTVTPLFSDIGDLAAGASVVVPATVADARFPEGGPSGGEDCADLSLGARYSLFCGVPIWYWVPVITLKPGCSSPGGGGWLPRWPPPPSSGSGPHWGSGPSQGGRGDGPVSNPDRPFLRPPPPQSEDLLCNPCGAKRAKAIVDCLLDVLGVDCAIGTVKNLAELIPACANPATRQKCLEDSLFAALGALSCFTPWGCAFDVAKAIGKCSPISSECRDPKTAKGCVIHCVKEFLGAVKTCAKDVALFAPYAAIIGTVIACGYDVLSACDEAGGGAAVGTGELAHLAELERQLARLEKIEGAFRLIFGDEAWLACQPGDIETLGVWLVTFLGAIDPTSEEAERISPPEAAWLAAMPIPPHLGDAHRERFIARWNRTRDYWSAGIFETRDLSPGEDPDFIAQDVWEERWGAARLAVIASEEEGFDGLYDGVRQAAMDVLEDLRARSSGIARAGGGAALEGGGATARAAGGGGAAGGSSGLCARVRVRLDQEIVVTSAAFRAVLELTNRSESSPLEEVSVEIWVRDAGGGDAADLFDVSEPELTGLDDASGGGTVAPGSSASARWTIIPTVDAAPDGPREYSVGGRLHYVLDGALFEIPLLPEPFTVLPSPRLDLHYFLGADVEGDDPLTRKVEPSEPFALALLVCNGGSGDLLDLRVEAMRPEIVENERGLAASFEILGCEVDGRPVPATLTPSIGRVEAGGSAVVLWWLSSSLAGRMTDFLASLTHLDGRGERRVSLVEGVTADLLEHVVRVDEPPGDDRPDFLLEREGAGGRELAIRTSDCGELPVRLLAEATVAPAPQGGPDAFRLQLPGEPPEGWVYLKLVDPELPAGELLRVARADGSELPPENVWWTRHRRLDAEGKPVLEWTLGLLDRDPAASYELTVVHRFRRADSNRDGKVDLSDALFTLGYLFLGGPRPECLDAADADDNETLEITDAVRTLSWLFLGGSAPPAPGPEECGPDPAGKLLDCRQSGGGCREP